MARKDRKSAIYETKKTVYENRLIYTGRKLTVYEKRRSWK